MNESSTTQDIRKSSSSPTFGHIDSSFKLIDETCLKKDRFEKYYMDSLIFDVCWDMYLAEDDERRIDDLFRALFSDDISKVKECITKNGKCIFPDTSTTDLGHEYYWNYDSIFSDFRCVKFPLRLVTDPETFLYLFDHAIKYEMANIDPKHWSIGGLLTYRYKEYVPGNFNFIDDHCNKPLFMLHPKLIYPDFGSDDDDEDNLPWEWYDWNFDVPNVDDVDHIFWKMVEILRTKYPNYPLIELVTDAVLENYARYDYEDEYNNDYSRYTVYFFESMLELYGENMGVMNPHTGRLPVFTALAFPGCSLMRALGIFMEPLFDGDSGIDATDPVTGLYPFMLAASSITEEVEEENDEDEERCDYLLTDVYILLREHPMHLVHPWLSYLDDYSGDVLDVDVGSGRVMKRELVGSGNEDEGIENESGVGLCGSNKRMKKSVE